MNFSLKLIHGKYHYINDCGKCNTIKRYNLCLWVMFETKDISMNQMSNSKVNTTLTNMCISINATTAHMDVLQACLSIVGPSPDVYINYTIPTPHLLNTDTISTPQNAHACLLCFVIKLKWNIYFVCLAWFPSKRSIHSTEKKMVPLCVHYETVDPDIMNPAQHQMRCW